MSSGIDRSLVRWRVAAYAVTGGAVALNLWIEWIDLERWWDRGPVLRAVGLLALVLSAVGLGITVGVHLFARSVRRTFRW